MDIFCKKYLMIFSFLFIVIGSIQADSESICGYKNSLSDSNFRKDSRYILFGSSGWKNSIEWWYNPANQYNGYSEKEIINRIKRAMNSWSKICSVKFEYRGKTSKKLSRSEDDIVIIGWDPKTSSNSSIIATAYHFPMVPTPKNRLRDGEIDINLNIFYKFQWSLKEFQGIMTHEIGHLIGIGHSNKNNSIMSSTPYMKLSEQARLRKDDIRAAQKLYPNKKASYGAVAVSKKAAKSGGSRNFSTLKKAKDAALNQCNVSDCKILVVVKNRCVAVAFANKHSYWTKSSNLSRAKRVALKNCQKSNKNCKIIRSFCSLN